MYHIKHEFLNLHKEGLALIFPLSIWGGVSDKSHQRRVKWMYRVIMVTITIHAWGKPCNISWSESALASNNAYTWKCTLPTSKMVCTHWAELQTVPRRDSVAFCICRYRDVDLYPPWWRGVSDGLHDEGGQEERKTYKCELSLYNLTFRAQSCRPSCWLSILGSRSCGPWLSTNWDSPN